MGFNSFVIIYDNPDKTYSPGSVVTGRTVIDVNSTKKVTAIAIKFKGRTKTQWSRGKNHFRAMEKYFENLSYLVHESSSSSPIELHPGKHTYEFSFTLPYELPSSFRYQVPKSSYKGDVKYTAKVTINRPWKIDQSEKCEFYVTQPLNLNLIDFVKEPATLTIVRAFCGCVSTGKIETRIKVPCSGYICGQTVPIIFEVDNDSSTQVLSINFKLKKYVVMFTKNRRAQMKTSEVLTEKQIQIQVGGGVTNVYFDKVVIPDTAIYNLIKSQIMDISYKLKFRMVLSGFHMDIKGELPVELGHIPLSYITPLQQLTNVSVPLLYN